MTVGSSVQATSAALFVNTLAGQFRSVQFQSGGSNRWGLQVTNAAEGGSNAGSNFAIASQTDAGGNLMTPLTITRSTGNVQLPTLQASTTYANDAAAASGGVPVGGLYRNGSAVQIRVA
jgi:hypothetical protein